MRSTARALPWGRSSAFTPARGVADERHTRAVHVCVGGGARRGVGDSPHATAPRTHASRPRSDAGVPRGCGILDAVLAPPGHHFRATAHFPRAASDSAAVPTMPQEFIDFRSLLERVLPLYALPAAERAQVRQA